MTDGDLRRVQTTWNALARGDDVFGAIWGFPYVQGQSAEQFFAAGEREIARVLRRARRLRLPKRRDAALDFGCGAGRLTQALARRFGRAVGVDASAEMVEAARRWNRHGERCEYVLNEEPSLARFADASFDFVYSNLVLQHMPEELGRRYVAELARVLRPGGLLVFQAPAERAPLPRLPRSAVIAEVEPLQARLRIPAGAKAVVRARVRNASREWWSPVRGPQMIYFANHWLAEDGRLLVQDDGRAPLPGDLGPGAAAELAVEVSAPADPGRYALELDLVQQDVAWFSERRKLSLRRTRTGRVAVEVGGAGYAPPELDPATQPPVDAEPDDEARMEMHAIPQAVVEAAVATGGARILRAEEDPRGALGWRTLLYWATK